MEDTYKEPLDPERLLQCPYDKHHQIRACRFPYHLIKCRKNHPDVAKKLATCPFNARHLVPRTEISHHMAICEDRCCLEQDAVKQTRNPGPDPVADSTRPCSPCEEDWDKELCEENSTPFVWGATDFCVNHRPASNIVMKRKSNLASGKPVPKSLPWKHGGYGQ